MSQLDFFYFFGEKSFCEKSFLVRKGFWWKECAGNRKKSFLMINFSVIFIGKIGFSEEEKKLLKKFLEKKVFGE